MNDNDKVILGVDIGGRGVRTRRIHIQGEKVTLLGKTVMHEGAVTPGRLIDHIGKETEGCSQIIVACAGEIEEQTLVVSSPNNHGLDGFNMGGELSGYFRIPTLVGNDMGVASLGMHRLAGYLAGTVITMTWSSGIGVRILKNGKIIFDTCELGHTVIGFDSPRLCGCGKPGHVEGLIGGKSLEPQVRLLLESNGFRLKKGANPMAGLDEAYLQNKQWAYALYAHIAEIMGAFISNLCCIGGKPTALLLKGSLARHSLQLPGIEDMIRQAMERFSMLKGIGDTPFILIPGPQVKCNPDDDTWYGCAELSRQA